MGTTAERTEAGTDVEVKPKRRAARRAAAPDAGAPDAGAPDAGEAGVVAPSRVIPPHLRFTTTTEDADDDGDDIDERTLPFELDGVELHIIVPRKLDEVLSQLIEANARRASTADQLYAGVRFMSRVLSPATVTHLQKRLDDDDDVFDRDKLYDILGAVIKTLNEYSDERNKRARRGGGRRR